MVYQAPIPSLFRRNTIGKVKTAFTRRAWDVYVAPNFSYFNEACSSGIWTIHNILGRRWDIAISKRVWVRFEEYVGTLLKRIDEHFSISQDDYQFFDWIVPTDDGFVLVEAKSLQFNLSSKRILRADGQRRSHSKIVEAGLMQQKIG